MFCSTNFSGAEIVMERLILKNTNVDAFCLCPPGEFANRLKLKGLKVIEENALISLDRQNTRYYKFILLLIVLKKIILINYKITKLLSQYKISIVHCNNLGAAFYVLPICLSNYFFSKKLKFIWSNHDLSYPNGKQSEFFAKASVRFFNKTIAVSQAVKQKFSIKFFNKIVVLYNGLDVQTFKYDLQKRTVFRDANILQNQEIAIGILGLISERKGQHFLIEQFVELLKKHTNIKLFIIGKFNSSEKKFQELIIKKIEYHSGINIVIVPHTENIIEAYCGLDIVVNCSLPLLSEPLGTTIYEAMACERVVLASNTGGAPEIVTNNNDGFLFEAGDEKDLYEKLSYIIRNFQAFQILKSNARKKVIEKFSILEMEIKYNNILNLL